DIFAAPETFEVIEGLIFIFVAGAFGCNDRLSILLIKIVLFGEQFRFFVRFSPRQLYVEFLNQVFECDKIDAREDESDDRLCNIDAAMARSKRYPVDGRNIYQPAAHESDDAEHVHVHDHDHCCPEQCMDDKQIRCDEQEREFQRFSDAGKYCCSCCRKHECQHLPPVLLRSGVVHGNTDAETAEYFNVALEQEAV